MCNSCRSRACSSITTVFTCTYGNMVADGSESRDSDFSELSFVVETLDHFSHLAFIVKIFLEAQKELLLSSCEAKIRASYGSSVRAGTASDGWGPPAGSSAAAPSTTCAARSSRPSQRSSAKIFLTRS